MTNWTEADIPDQAGRTVLVTGANSGLGLRTARVLAAAGARVLMACRSAERGATALRTVTEAGGQAELVSLDLADLASVRAAAEQVRERCPDGLDVLVNNAGLMATPQRRTTDGFDLQFGTNHLGHAALTWLLLPALADKPDSRVVTLSSMAAQGGRIDLDDPNYEHRAYRSISAYGQAKLANLLFALELDRRLRQAGQDTLSVAAHPGYTATELSANMMKSRYSGFRRQLALAGMAVADRTVAQSVTMGTLPQLYAATAPEVRGGEYYGPHSLIGQTRGYPTRVPVPRAALRRDVPAGLWDLTIRLTGVDPKL
jgi:NAD(P)-dependent dehydrogenase (short-subunit alcohol dehydrogenase family)